MRLQVGKPDSIEVDAVIGADGANSRVAKEIGAGDYDYAIAFQVSPTLQLRPVVPCRAWQPQGVKSPAAGRQCGVHASLAMAFDGF